MSLALNNPQKFFGIMNVKYIVSSKPFNRTGFSFYSTFNISGNMISKGSYPRDGTGYIYKNENYLPRAFFVNESMLVIGDSAHVQNAGYWVLLNKNFDPTKLAVVLYEGKDLSQVSVSELSRFGSIILLSGSITSQNDILKLGNYVDNGGRIFPDVLNNEQSLNETEVNEYLASRISGFKPVEITRYYTEDPNTLEIKAPGSKGFIYLSEKMTLYDGWKAVSNNREKSLLKANGIFTAVFVDENDGLIRFDFLPKAYKIGHTITNISVVLLILIVVFYIFRLKKIKNKPEKHK
jgi:hypothetical protein